MSAPWYIDGGPTVLHVDVILHSIRKPGTKKWRRYVAGTLLRLLEAYGVSARVRRELDAWWSAPAGRKPAPAHLLSVSAPRRRRKA